MADATSEHRWKRPSDRLELLAIDVAQRAQPPAADGLQHAQCGLALPAPLVVRRLGQTAPPHGVAHHHGGAVREDLMPERDITAVHVKGVAATRERTDEGVHDAGGHPARVLRLLTDACQLDSVQRGPRESQHGSACGDLERGARREAGTDRHIPVDGQLAAAHGDAAPPQRRRHPVHEDRPLRPVLVRWRIKVKRQLPIMVVHGQEGDAPVCCAPCPRSGPAPEGRWAARSPRCSRCAHRSG